MNPVVFLRLWLTLIAVLYAPAILAQAQPQHSKIALVIGNSDYNHLSHLKNATNDAKAIARVLSDLGYTVFLTQDTSASDLKRTLDFVSTQAAQADQLILYFAGHSHNENGTASLLAIDEKPSEKTAITATDLLAYFPNPFTQKVIIWDACLEHAPNSPSTPSNNILLPANLPPETAFVFATSYGQAAYDGTGKHSLFAGALLDRLIADGTELMPTIQSVRSDVVQASRSHQMPITLSTLTRPFDLNSKQPQNQYDTPTRRLLQSYSSTGFGNKPLLKNLSEGAIK